MENEAARVQIGNYVVGRATFSRYVFPFFWFLGQVRDLPRISTLH